MGALGRADRHLGKVEARYGVGGDGGGHRGLRPVAERVVDQNKGSQKSSKNYASPDNLDNNRL